MTNVLRYEAYIKLIRIWSALLSVKEKIVDRFRTPSCFSPFYTPVLNKTDALWMALSVRPDVCRAQFLFLSHRVMSLFVI